jgi:hypothetical protein
MSDFFGGDAFDAIADKLDVEMTDELSSALAEEPIYTLDSTFSDDFDDLIDFDFEKRISAHQALGHPLFTAPNGLREDEYSGS